MEGAKFKNGDLVKLKSGGPEMTVEKITKNPFDQEKRLVVACVWFEGTELKRGTFYEDNLTV